ncbi:MAG TPA: WYL domain-containing protein, partial [Candidatus Anaerobiospirillum pullistercoris]|nr:WYL domain-containing protein [Candidatus Anaerobiospirillum pullistercoris]
NVGIATFVPPRRNISTEVLFNLLEAIRCKMAVHISYVSVSSNNNTDHLIAPHGLAFDGLRWHVRAYCYDRHAFRDFVLSRILRCAVPEISAPSDRFPDPIGNGFREVGTTGDDDADWNELIDLVLRANPALPERARRAIELDYGMDEDGTVVYTCRRALVFYTLNWLRLTKDDEVLPPERRQVVLDNAPEVYRRMQGGN